MLRRVAFLAASAALLVSLGGCALNFLNLERRAAWRSAAEAQCVSSRRLAAADVIERVRAINGSGTCGIDSPLRVSSLANGQIRIGPTATLGCPVTAAVEHWLANAVMPAALERLGSPVVEIKQLSAYACRTMNNVRGADLSEHAFGNALDVGAFRLADGREINVLRGWRGAQEERDFLRVVFLAACQQFGTVLGPGSDGHHEDHFHLDLAQHGRDGTTRYCRPQNVTPPAPVVPAPFFGFPVAGLPGAAGAAGFAAETPANGPPGFAAPVDPGVTAAIGAAGTPEMHLLDP